MHKISSMIGVVVGVVIMILSILVFTYEVDITTPKMESVSFSSIDSPAYEADEFYGGDAYTGMQQAAAQAANNIIPVFNAVKAQNKAIGTMNKNLEKQAKAESQNLESAIDAVKFCFGAILLSLGLVTVAKYVGEIVDKKKEESTADVPPADTY